MSSKCLIFLALFALVYAQNTTHTSNSSETVLVKNGTTTEAPVRNGTTSEAPVHNTTTVAPTTTTPHPNTTTIKPTPEPTPAPIPKAEKFDGNVTVGENTCVRVDFEVTVTIKYNNTEGHVKTAGFVIPSNASVDTARSHCSSNDTETEAIAIKFVNDENTSANLTLTFNKTDSGVALIKIDMSFNATAELLPGLDSKELGIVSANNDSLSLFKVASVHSYVCSAVQPAPLKVQGKSENMITDVQIEFTNSKVEAYIDKKNKGSFDSEIDCKSADISDVVPIAVGAALAGLVVIVLIAYFIGRRRSRRLAYQSV